MGLIFIYYVSDGRGEEKKKEKEKAQWNVVS